MLRPLFCVLSECLAAIEKVSASIENFQDDDGETDRQMQEKKKGRCSHNIDVSYSLSAAHHRAM